MTWDSSRRKLGVPESAWTTLNPRTGFRVSLSRERGMEASLGTIPLPSSASPAPSPLPSMATPLPARQSAAALLSVLVSFRDLIVHSLHLLVLLVIRMLLSTGLSCVRSALCSLGLRALVSEADCGGGDMEKLLTSSVQGSMKAKGHLLPPRHDNDNQRLTIVLDLDETLVCAYSTEGLPAQLHTAACQGGIQWFTLDCAAPDDQDEAGAPKVHNVTVYQRPGLKDFLASASQLGEVVLFTAGLEGYARPLVDRIDPEGRISHRLYRTATVSTPYREHVKDLEVLGRNPRRTVIIDNNPFSFLVQPVNGIPCVPFTGDNSKDRQLQEVLLPMLEQLSALEDVRPYLLSKFQMPAWFRSRGVPVAEPQLEDLSPPPVRPMPASLLPSCAPISPFRVSELEANKAVR